MSKRYEIADNIIEALRAMSGENNDKTVSDILSEITGVKKRVRGPKDIYKLEPLLFGEYQLFMWALIDNRGDRSSFLNSLHSQVNKRKDLGQDFTWRTNETCTIITRIQ